MEHWLVLELLVLTVLLTASGLFTALKRTRLSFHVDLPPRDGPTPIQLAPVAPTETLATIANSSRSLMLDNLMAQMQAQKQAARMADMYGPGNAAMSQLGRGLMRNDPHGNNYSGPDWMSGLYQGNPLERWRSNWP